MLRQLIARNCNFIKICRPEILARALSRDNKIANNKYYCSQANRKRINFSEQYHCERKDSDETYSKRNNRTINNQEGWDVRNFALIVVGIAAYLLINGQISKADQEEDENKVGIKGSQKQESIDAVSKELSANFPKTVEHYVDLQGKRELLDKKLSENEIVVISGAGGMGKSTLAIQYGNNCQQRGDTQVIWIKGTQIEEEFLRLAALLEIETNGLNREIIRNLVYGNLQILFDTNALLFVFDNVETKEKIKEYLINLPNTAKVIITTRNEDLLEGIKPLRIKGFKKEEASFYLIKLLKISQAEAEKIINVVGESPFRLSIAGAYLKNYPSTSVDELTEKFLQIKRGHSANEEIYPEVELLFRNLKKDSPKAWELLKYLAYMDPEGIPVSLLKEIMGQTVSKLEETVNKIKELSLIKANEKTIKVTHRIIQDETKKALIDEDNNQVEQLLKTLIIKVDSVFPKVNRSPENWKLAIEWVNHAKILIEEAKENFISERINLLGKVGDYYYHISFNYKEAIDNYNKALVLSDDSVQKASIFHSIGATYWQLGGKENIEKALGHYENALSIYRDSENHSAVAILLNKKGLAYWRLGGEKNIRMCLKYCEEGLEIQQNLFPGNDSDLSNTLNSIGSAYWQLGGKENLGEALIYFQRALKMRRALFPGNNVDVASSLNNIGLIYKYFGGKENMQKALEYYGESLEMRRNLFRGNHPNIASSLGNIGSVYLNLDGEENIYNALKYFNESLIMYRKLFFDGHIDFARFLSAKGFAYIKLGKEDNVRRGLKCCEKSLKIQQKLFSGNHSDLAQTLDRIGSGYCQLEEKENFAKALWYLEKGLKMRLALFDGNHVDIGSSLDNLAQIYQNFNDENKALEYYKQAYGIYYSNEDGASTKKVRAKIELLEPNFFENQVQTLKERDCLGGNRVEAECRWIITSRGESTSELITLKQRIQKSILNDVVKAAENYGWTNINLFGWDYGIKGYIEPEYLKIKLKELDNSENIEMTQMLCFESMNLGIMKSEKKPYSAVREFTRNNQELVKKVAKKHPEFFVDGSIVEECVKAMPDDASFKEHIFKHVKYMGMEARKEREF